MAYYKIVQTIEDGIKYLSTVPHQWERDGVLYWPPTKNTNKYVRDINSTPGLNWSKQPCIVKKSNLSTLLEARQIENSMADFTDTEAEENYEERKRNKRKHPSQQDSSQIADFNYLIEAGSVINKKNHTDQSNVATSSTATNIIAPQIAETQPIFNIVDEQSNIAYVDTQYTSTGIITKELTSVPDEVELIDFGIMLEKINQTQKHMLENNAKIENISKEISSLHVKFDRMIDILTKITSVSNERNLNTKGDLKETINKIITFPIENEDGVETFERKLESDKNFKLLFVEYMSRIGGKTGDKNGTKIAYKIIDEFFTRTLLLKYSWTGSSKNKEKKISFLKYKNVINVFYEIVHIADNRYTSCENEDFFRKILKNSLSRSNQICMKRKVDEISNENLENRTVENNDNESTNKPCDGEKELSNEVADEEDMENKTD